MMAHISHFIVFVKEMLFIYTHALLMMDVNYISNHWQVRKNTKLFKNNYFCQQAKP